VFAELAEWWDAQPFVRQIPFLSTAILSCWEEGFDEAGSRLHVMLLKRDGDLVAALPLYEGGGRLRSLSQEHASSIDIVHGEDPEVVDQLPAWLDSLKIAHLYRVREESPIVAALETHPRWNVQRVLRGPYVDLEGGLGARSRRPSNDFLKGLRRRRRRLEEMGTVTYVDHSSPDEVDSLLNRGLELEVGGWKGERGVATLQVPTHERWFRNVAEVAQDRGWLRLSGLYLEDRLLAWSYDLVYSGRRHGLIAAYDESVDVKPMSPGNLLVHEILEHSSAAGLDRYEFGNGDHSWKYDWTDSERRVYDLLIFGSGISGRAASGLRKLREARRSSTSAKTDATAG
jgi:CelD/BcsL family acetyltransferase involved in cellulose biosynthesis